MDIEVFGTRNSVANYDRLYHDTTMKMCRSTHNALHVEHLTVFYVVKW